MAARSEPVPVTTDIPALAAGLVTVVAWGSAFVGIRSAGHSLSPGSIALGRLLVCSAILGAVALWRRERLPIRRDLVPIAAFGVLWLGVYSVTLNAAERRVDAGTAAMLVNLGPILIALLAGILLQGGLPAQALCRNDDRLCGLRGDRGRYDRFELECRARDCALPDRRVRVLGRGRRPEDCARPRSPFVVTWLGCTAATIACLPFAPGLVSEASDASTGALLWTVYLGAIPTALGFAAWTFALGRTSAGRMGSTHLSLPAGRDPARLADPQRAAGVARVRRRASASPASRSRDDARGRRPGAARRSPRACAAGSRSRRARPRRGRSRTE